MSAAQNRFRQACTPTGESAVQAVFAKGRVAARVATS